MLFSIFIFICVLSFLVFVHELGHFLAAKACGIYVDQFSIGMPPRLFGVRWGDTDYCIGALPIGGYVKMAGQEDAPLSEEEREQTYGHVPEDQWFNKKKYWQKVFVLVAGPAMNLVTAAVLYTLIAALGTNVPEWELSAKVGKVEAESPAASAPLYLAQAGKALDSYEGPPDAVGWKTGDVVLSINGKDAENFSALGMSAVLYPPDEVRYMRLERTGAEGEKVEYISPIKPKLMDPEDENPRYGVGQFSSAEIMKVQPDSPAERAGLQAGDLVLRVNGEIADRGEFSDVTADTPPGEEMTITVLRDGKETDVKVTPQSEGRLRDVVLAARNENEEEAGPLEVLGVGKEFGEATGLQRKDVIVAVNGQVMSKKELDEYAKAHAGTSIEVLVERPAILLGLVQRREELQLELPIEEVRSLGVMHAAHLVPLDYPVSRWIPEGYRQCKLALDTMGEILASLFAGNVSPKNLGGPLMIGSVASQAAEIGWKTLVKWTAFISINLFVMNLLPLPVLDGGQIVLNTVEAVRRKPVPPKVQEYYQLVGIILVVGLMLYVSGNDVMRWVDGLRP